MLTLYPPTWGLKNRPTGRNGSNMFLFAFYWRGHPHAAAIAAHEVAEARRSFLPSLLAVAIGAAAMHFLALPSFGPVDLPTTIIADLIGAMLILLVYMMLPGRKKSTNTYGEAVESVVESRLYGMTLEEAVLEGAEQLSRGYDTGSVSQSIEQLMKYIPAATKWVDRNWPLVLKAHRSQL